jgi:hypothetical protein
MTNSPPEVAALRELIVSMRHSAGQWMVPGWDGHKVADLLEKVLASTAAKADAGEWIPVSERLPEALGKHGYTMNVLVAVTCGNGLNMVREDRYDHHSKTWEEFHTDYSYTVTHWMDLPEHLAASPKESCRWKMFNNGEAQQRRQERKSPPPVAPKAEQAATQAEAITLTDAQIDEALEAWFESGPVGADQKTDRTRMRSAILAASLAAPAAPTGAQAEPTGEFTDADLEPPEQLAGRLIDAWIAEHGKQIPWVKAVEITAIVTKMPEAERLRLLNLE